MTTILNNIKSRFAPPRPSAMIESLRGIGYTPETAIADIIDNSISAKAKVVSVNFSKEFITILDDGCGMNDQELELAMWLGDKNPLDARDPEDLGRFGLGLKTASFSQCRRLTVASKKNNTISCLRWDLDVLAEVNDGNWHLLEGAAESSMPLLKVLDELDSGTLVIWETMDRIITHGFDDQSLLNLIDQVEIHLSMVFHLLIEETNLNKLTIKINNKAIAPWDPFLANHEGTWSSPPVNIPTNVGLINVQCFVLPHKDNLSEEDHEIAAGPQGWTSQQGFYIYRNKRLLVPGSWLGLGKLKPWIKEEAYRLARIKVNIPNSADKEWKIDIRKSIARPPAAIKNIFIKLAEDTRERARRVFATRGQQMRNAQQVPIIQAWRTERTTTSVRYKIDNDHPAIKTLLDDAGSLTSQIKAAFRVLEETVPVQRIWLDTAETHETPLVGFNETPSEEIVAVLKVMFKNMITRKGMSPQMAREQLLLAEPFNNYPDLVASLPDNLI